MPKSRQQQLSQILLDFYKQPVARVSLELILSVLAIIFFAIFAIKPTLETMADLVKEIQDKSELESQMDLKISSLYTAQSQYYKYSDQFYLLEQAIPQEFNLVESIKILEKLAGEERLAIERISLSNIPKKTNEAVLAAADFADFKRDFVVLNVDVLGDYLTIRQFVEKVINLRKIMIVDQVSFSKKTEQQGLSARIRVSFPYYYYEE